MLSVLIMGLTAIGCQSHPRITEADIHQAQQTWGAGVVAIGKAYQAGNDYKAVASDHVDALYAFQMGDVLFKPTKAADEQFRTTRDGAISYFVGHNSGFPEDKGFALQPWTKVRFENAAIHIDDDSALAMGNYYFTPHTAHGGGQPVKVEYSFGYVRDDKGQLRIVLHHSSLPYTP